ncbi:hypothetical protein [Hymenobacter sp. BRD67]|uniref:hypothetical protein n=1 Tax=Hymenobacter sp. BRD67 TaxID=2675877 RepID=UPI0015634D6F|nr:hypothetical protein [Hymenobacter sp. BRD67]QKG55079.1 hypothetical protein GKZ67_21895 [Hymenobacter sp. BRD67]
MNLSGTLGEWHASLNQAVFYTRLTNTLIADPVQFAQGITEFRNAPTPITSRGWKPTCACAARRCNSSPPTP